MGGALTSIVTNTEAVHDQLERDAHEQFPYFRFNVERDVGDIGLEDWKKLSKMAAHTQAYMRTFEMEMKKISCAKCLIDPTAFRMYLLYKVNVESRISVPEYFIVPYQENKLFVGREELLSRLFDLLCQCKEYENNHRVALHGLGGVGKTQTAIKYIYTRRKYYRSIFWISAVNQTTLFTDFQKILALTQPDITIPGSEPTQIARLVITWLENQTSWLLVIDNLDDIKVIDGYLPVNSDKKHTLITTRNPNGENIPAQSLKVDIMSQQDATKFFLIRSGFNFDSESEATEAAKVVKELGYLPLAIEQAAAYTRESKIKIKEFLPRYQKSEASRRELQQRPPYGNRQYDYTVATTWKVSFDFIIKDANYGGHIAATLLQLFASLNPDGILIDFLQCGAEVLLDDIHNVIIDDIRLDRALELLQRFSLITLISEPRSIMIHRLV
jgi:hypothetical protein